MNTTRRSASPVLTGVRRRHRHKGTMRQALLEKIVEEITHPVGPPPAIDGLSRGDQLTLTDAEKIRLTPALIQAVHDGYIPGVRSREKVARDLDLRLVIVKHILAGRIGFPTMAPELPADYFGWSIDLADRHVLRRLYERYKDNKNRPLVLTRAHHQEFVDRISQREGELVSRRDVTTLRAVEFSFGNPIFIVTSELTGHAVTALCPKPYVRHDGRWIRHSHLPQMQLQDPVMGERPLTRIQAAFSAHMLGD
jgi:hypothetical protein